MRNYIVASWNDADQYDYSGEMLGGSRQGKSQRVHFNPDGSACVASYGDPVEAKKPSIHDKILPQLRTLNKRLAEIQELEAAYKSGSISADEYTVLRSVAFHKKDRAEALYKLAINKGKTREKSLENGDKISYANNVPPVEVSDIADEQSTQEYDDSYDDSLPHLFQDVKKTNVFYGLVKFSVKCVNNTCKGWKGLVEFKHKVSKYIEGL
jgi:hypothetical protein